MIPTFLTFECHMIADCVSMWERLFLSRILYSDHTHPMDNGLRQGDRLFRGRTA